MPKPYGILAANDIEGEEVLRRCAKCGFRVPNVVAVLGFDTRADICEGTSPTLSSLDPGVQAQYADAASLLAELMDGGTRKLPSGNDDSAASSASAPARPP